MSLLGNFLIQRALRRAAFEALVDRRRSRMHAARGRFTRADVAELLPVVWRFAEAQPADVAGQPARIATTLHLAAFARAFLDALMLREVEREYAIELVADLICRLEKPAVHACCPVAEHLHAHDADDLCRAAFCSAR